MRSFPAAITAELTRFTSRLAYLVEITPVKTGTPARLCSMLPVTWDGQAWPHAHFVMPQPPTWEGNSAMQWSIALDNTSRVFGALALSTGLRGARFRSWLIAGGNPYPAVGDVQPWLWGWLVDCSISSDTLEATVSTEYSIESVTPRQRIYKPEYNWPPPLNSTLSWGGGVIQFTDGVST